MASIRKRQRKDGTTSWVVLWRDRETGKQTSRSLATEADAKTLKDFLDSNGQSFAQAAQAAGRLRSKSLTVQKIVSQHIEALTNASSGTRETYRRQAKIHIYPALGAIPVDTLTRYEIATWFNGLPVSAKSKKNIHAILCMPIIGVPRLGIIRSHWWQGNILTRTRVISVTKCNLLETQGVYLEVGWLPSQPQPKSNKQERAYGQI